MRAALCSKTIGYKEIVLLLKRLHWHGAKTNKLWLQKAKEQRKKDTGQQCGPVQSSAVQWLSVTRSSDLVQ
jgi:hypothetical protein